MKKIVPILIFVLTAAHLFSLDIWINGEYQQSFSLEELTEYALPGYQYERNVGHNEAEGYLKISQIVPLFRDIYRIEAYGGRNKIILEEPKGLLESLALAFTDEKYYLIREDYRFENPSRIDIWGTLSDEKELIALYPAQDDLTKDQLEAFCRFHDLDLTALPSDNPARELTNRIYQKKTIPHIIIFPESSLPALEGRIANKKDYYFSVLALFSEKGQWRQPMDLEEILAESSHTYSWNCYDYKTFTLFEQYYSSLPDNMGNSFKQALVLNRSLKEMGILSISSDPQGEKKDFYIADSNEIPLASTVCYPDFIRPLFNFTCLATPLARKDSLISSAVAEHLLSPATQDLIGWERNGLYPIVDPEKKTHPADPCLILLNRYKNGSIRIPYSDTVIDLMDNWQTLSRLAVNSALSIDDLIESARLHKEGVY